LREFQDAAKGSIQLAFAIESQHGAEDRVDVDKATDHDLPVRLETSPLSVRAKRLTPTFSPAQETR
jgi:hypothetical protein